MTGAIITFATVAVAFGALTYLLHRSFHRRLVKYVPALLALGVALQNFYLARTAPSEGFQDLARFVYAMLAAVAMLASLATALYLDYLHPKKEARKGSHEGEGHV